MAFSEVRLNAEDPQQVPEDSIERDVADVDDAPRERLQIRVCGVL